MTLDPNELLRRELLLRAMFPVMTRDALLRFAEQMQPLTVTAGTRLFEVGSAPETVFFLMQGRVEMAAEGEATWSFGPRSVVGVIDAMIGRPRARSGVATQDSELLTLPVSEWLDLLEYDSNSARGSIRNFAQQLHKRWLAWAKSSSGPVALEPIEPSPAALSNYDKVLALRRVAFLKPAGMQAIVSLAAVAEEIRLEAQQELFAAGSSVDALHMIVQGRVALESARETHLVQSAGDLVGGPSALSGAQSEYGARALTPSVLLRLHEQDYYDQVEEHARLARGTLAYLVAEFERVLKQDPPTAPEGAVNGSAAPGAGVKAR